jgi:hypothetical protein
LKPVRRRAKKDATKVRRGEIKEGITPRKEV